MLAGNGDSFVLERFKGAPGDQKRPHPPPHSPSGAKGNILLAQPSVGSVADFGEG